MCPVRGDAGRPGGHREVPTVPLGCPRPNATAFPPRGVDVMARTIAHFPASTQENNAAADFAPLTETDIAAQTDAGSFSRGKTDFRRTRICKSVRRGNLLR